MPPSAASMPTFNVHYVNRAVQSKKTLRQDLDMIAQEMAIAEERYRCKAEHNWREYMQTWDTQNSHECYLRCLITEAYHYRMSKCSDEASRTAVREEIKELSDRIAFLMMEEEEDRYIEALNEIGKLRLFIA